MSVSFPIRISHALDAKLTEAAEKLGTTKLEATRLLLNVGYADLKRIDFDISSVIVAAARRPAAKKKLAAKNAKKKPA